MPLRQHQDQSQNQSQNRGRNAHLSGLAAEAGVLRAYAARGAALRATRWRGEAGEIDLIVQEHGELVFCEVKKSRSHAAAAQSLSPAQRARIVRTAGEYIDQHPDLALSPLRFDLATVDGTGMVHILPNAFGEDSFW